MSQEQFHDLGFRQLGPSAFRQERMTLLDVVETLSTTAREPQASDVARSVGRMINEGKIRFHGKLKGLKVRVTDN